LVAPILRRLLRSDEVTGDEATRRSVTLAPDSMRFRWFAPLLIVLALLPACDEDAPSAPIVCAVEQSSSACFRCQAQRCGTELDRCYGAGFHEGRSVGSTIKRCLWNTATQKYDVNCTFSGGLSRDRLSHGDAAEVYPDLPCGWLAVCVQSCGCGVDCRTNCRSPSLSTAFAEDSRYTPEDCTACEDMGLTDCMRRSCAAECGSGDAGTD
jgi:hypothetical protein